MDVALAVTVALVLSLTLLFVPSGYPVAKSTSLHTIELHIEEAATEVPEPQQKILESGKELKERLDPLISTGQLRIQDLTLEEHYRYKREKRKSEQRDERKKSRSKSVIKKTEQKEQLAQQQVQPVIFFPTDYVAEQEMIDYLNDKFEEIRQFYLAEYGSTFTMLAPQVVSGDNDHEWYWCVDQQPNCQPNNFEHNIIAELQNKGFPVHGDWNQFPSDRVVWVVAFGGGGYAGGRTYPTGGGFSMLGDAGIYAAKDNNCDRILDKYFSTDNHPNVVDSCKNSWIPSGKQYGFGIGALGHELGHGFDLPHPDGYSGTTAQDWEETLMGYHWNYPNTGLLQQDKDRLDNSPFFNAFS